jgi:uncharacterized protein (DUF885 family)
MKKFIALSVWISMICYAGIAQQFAFYEPIVSYQADRATLERKYTLRETQEYYDRISRLYNDWLSYIESVDYKGLTPDGKIDYLLFRNFLKKSIFFHQLEEQAYQEVAHVTAFAEDLYRFIRERRRGKTVDGAAEAVIFHAAANSFGKATIALDQQPLFDNWMVAAKAAAVVKDLKENLDEAFQFYYGYHPDFTWWAKEPHDKLQEEIGKYEKKLEQHYATTLIRDDGSGIVGKPEGRHALINRLQYEFIPYTPEELLAVGKEQLDWCRHEMVLAAREMGFDDDWRAALEYVKDQYVPAGEQPEMINRLAEEAIAFIEENDLLTVPELAKETWRMQMMSPEMQLVNPFFLGGEEIRISYPTNTMSHDAKMMSLRGNNPHFCMATVHHELIAGHHLQGFVNQRNKPYRRILGTPFWTEGWALHWEFLLYEMGLPPSPEDRMGFLFWRKHRAARIIFSLNYHLGLMSPQECIDFLVSEVGHERANAEAEVRRSFMGRYDPLYQLAYMIGGIQFQALRHELVDGRQMTLKAFHDAVLKQNNLPIELLRAVLMETELPENFSTNWRFLDN